MIIKIILDLSEQANYKGRKRKKEGEREQMHAHVYLWRI